MIVPDFYEIRDIEADSCVTCRFRKNPDEDGQHAQEFPMCYEIEGAICGEQEVEALDRRSDGVIVCAKYMPGDPWDFVPDPGQTELFEE